MKGLDLSIHNLINQTTVKTYLRASQLKCFDSLSHFHWSSSRNQSQRNLSIADSLAILARNAALRIEKGAVHIRKNTFDGHNVVLFSSLSASV